MELARQAPSALANDAEHAVAKEDEFRLFYDRTARPLRAYLYRMLNDVSRADDILQEAYLRLLQARVPANFSDEHRKNYLFRIATNLLHDEAKSRRGAPLKDYASESDVAGEVLERTDRAKYWEQLTPRQRELLWLAYVEQFSHREIAGMIGAKAPSIRPMLSRARERCSEILKQGGFRSA